MNNIVKKIKSIIKGTAPASTYGTNPNDPWSAKAGIAENSNESMLDSYLNSRGINPRFISTDTRISHAKSSEFMKWKNDHQFESVQEETDKKDTVTFDIPLLIRVLELAREDIKSDMDLHKVVEKLINIRDKGMLTMDDYDYIAKLKEEYELQEGQFKRGVIDREEDARLNKMTTLKKFRADADARTKKHDAIEKNSGGMTSAIDRLQAHMNKEENELAKKAAKYDWSKRMPKQKKPIQHMGQIELKKKQLAKEEVEQIDEISRKALDTYKAGSLASLKNAQSNRDAASHGKDFSPAFAKLHKKSNEIAKKRTQGLIGYMQRKGGMKPFSEDIFQDGQAPTQTSFDGANAPDNTEPKTNSRRTEMSKSARIIKSLYKHHNMKEELYDSEKEDKSVASYGKKPKMKTTKPEDSFGDNPPTAAAVLTGGKTLTGSTRDTLEIDPEMKRPTRPDGKKQEKN